MASTSLTIAESDAAGTDRGFVRVEDVAVDCHVRLTYCISHRQLDCIFPPRVKLTWGQCHVRTEIVRKEHEQIEANVNM